jgi:hypothetical protein
MVEIVHADALPRNYVQYRQTLETSVASLSGTVPNMSVILECMYGNDWRRRASLVFARRYGTICKVGSGKLGVPRKMLQHILDRASDPVLRDEFIKHQRTAFEAQLALRLERRAFIVRWLRLLLSGEAVLPNGQKIVGSQHGFSRKRTVA